MLAIYTRLSKEDALSASIENQKREGLEFFDSNNFSKHQIYNEGEGVSGTLDIENRPKLLELISDIKKGVINSVWMRNQNRLDRNTLTFYIFVDAVKNKGIDVYFGNNDKLDFNDPATLLQSSILSSLNQYQAQLQSHQTKRALKDNARLGKIWGIIPYGYRSDSNKLPYIDEEEAKIIKRIFKEYLSGKGLRAIANSLNKDKIPTKYNKYKNKTLKLKNIYTNKVTLKNTQDIVWVENTINNILKNTWYIGKRKYSGDFYEVPKIIDRVLFDKVQKAIESRKGRRTSIAKYNYLLKGLLRCKKCGRNYYGRSRKDGSDNYYMCSSNRTTVTKCGNSGINIPKLESFIIKHLFKTSDLLEFLKKNDKDNTIIKSLKEQLLEIEKKQKTTDSEIKKLLNLLLDDELKDDSLIKEKYKNKKKLKEELKNEQLKLEDKIQNVSSNKGIKEYSNIFKAQQEYTNFESFKKAVNQIIENITIDSHVVRYITKKEIVFTISIEYKNLNIGGSKSMDFLTVRPLDIWIYKYENTGQEGLDKNLKMLMDNMSKGEFEIVQNLKNIGYNEDSINKHSPLETIILDKKDIYNFNI